MFSELEQYLDKIGEEENIPASDCIVYHGHDVVFRHMRGYSDAAKTKPVSAQDRYILYSATKPLTVTAVMQLIEQGKLHLEDELCQYLPEFTQMYVKDVPAKKKITIQNLLQMSAGLNYDLNGPGIRAVIEKNPEATLADIVKGIAAQPLDFEPGTHYRYSLCHDVLARVIEVVSGMTYGAYMKKNLFDPLGMEHTGYSIEEAEPYLTEQYTPDEWPNQRKTMGAYNQFRLTPNYESGGAGVISTVDDYGKFVEAMCNYGVSASGVQILSEESIDKMRFMWLEGVPYEDFRHIERQRGYGYGLGVRTMVDKIISGAKSPVGEFGWGGAAGSYMLVDVENQIGIFYAQEVFAHAIVAQEVQPRIRDLVYEALESRG